MAAPLLCPPVSAGLLLTYSQFYVGYAEPLRVKLAALYEVTDGSQVTPRKLRGYSDQAFLWQYSDETLSDVCQHLDDAANNSGLPLNWPSDSPFCGRSRALDSYIRNLRQQVGAYLDLDANDPKRKELCLDIEIARRTCLTITQIGGDIRSLLTRPEWKAFLGGLGNSIDMLSVKGWLAVNAANDAWYAEQDWRKKLTAIAHKIRQELNASIVTDLSPLEEAAIELMGAACAQAPGQKLIHSYLQIVDPLLGHGIDCGELAVDCDLLKGLAKGMSNAGHKWFYQGLFVEMCSKVIPELIPGFTFDPSAGNASLKLATALEKLGEPQRAKPTQEQIDPKIEQLRDGLCGLIFSSRKLLEVASEVAKDNTPIRQLNEDSQVSDKEIEDALRWFWEDIDRSQVALSGMRPSSVALMCKFSRQSVWSLDLKRILDKMTDWVRFTRSQKYGIDSAAFRSAVRFEIPDWQQYQADLHAQQELLGTLASSPADIDSRQSVEGPVAPQVPLKALEPKESAQNDQTSTVVAAAVVAEVKPLIEEIAKNAKSGKKKGERVANPVKKRKQLEVVLRMKFKAQGSLPTMVKIHEEYGCSTGLINSCEVWKEWMAIKKNKGKLAKVSAVGDRIDYAADKKALSPDEIAMAKEALEQNKDAAAELLAKLVAESDRENKEDPSPVTATRRRFKKG